MTLIRYANESDLPLLVEHDKHIAKDELQNTVRLQRVLILENEDGFAGWLRYNLFWDNTPFMNMLYLLENFRGRGLGGQLTAFWENEMRQQGYKEVLTSTLSDEHAQFFYRKHGYVDCGSLLLPGEPLEIIFMKKI